MSVFIAVISVTAAAVFIVAAVSGITVIVIVVVVVVVNFLDILQRDKNKGFVVGPGGCQVVASFPGESNLSPARLVHHVFAVL